LLSTLELPLKPGYVREPDCSHVIAEKPVVQGSKYTREIKECVPNTSFSPNPQDMDIPMSVRLFRTPGHPEGPKSHRQKGMDK
jgi:hypothetical protein